MEFTNGSSNWIFQHPVKKITTELDVEAFKESLLFRELIDFLNALSVPIKGYPIDERRPNKPSIKRLVEILDSMELWIDFIPPCAGQMRFGNRAFQQWYDKLQDVRILL